MDIVKALDIGIQVAIQYTVNGQESTAQVNQFPFLIGRNSTSVHLALSDATVSRIHAKLTCQDGKVFLENISATNITVVNDRPISAPTQISNGDRAVMGSSQLTFIIEQNVEQSVVPESWQPRYCRMCGNNMKSNEVFCGVCGTRAVVEITAQFMFCENCGSKHSGDSRFCSNCGNPTNLGRQQRFTSRSEFIVAPQLFASQRAKRKVPMVAIAIAVVIAIAVIVAAFMWFGSCGDVAVGNQYVEAMCQNNENKLKELIPTELLNNNIMDRYRGLNTWRIHYE